MVVKWTSIALVATACGRMAFDPQSSPDAAVCPVGSSCTPAAVCWAGTCDLSAACIPTIPLEGTCPGGACGSDGVCDGVAAMPIVGGTAANQLLGMGIAWQPARGLVGAPRAGIARVVDKGVDGTWGLTATLSSSIGGPNTDFGLAVDLDGDRALVGSHSYNIGHGAAAVFERQPDGSWPSVATLQVAGTFDFGSAVALEGDRALIGSESSDTAYVFERSASGVWSVVATLGPYTYDFGKNVLLAGDRAFVSSTWEPNTDGAECGSVRIFERDSSGAWNLVAHLQPPVSEKVDAFGIGMAADGDVLAVGGEWASRDLGYAGVVIIYRRGADGQWAFEAALHETAEVVSGSLGRGVAVRGDRVVATMVRPTDGLLAVFRRQPDGRWLEVARRVDPLGAQAGYGTGGVESDLQVRLLGDLALVGAPYRSATSGYEGAVVTYDLTGL